jgi:hypothetical protein
MDRARQLLLHVLFFHEAKAAEAARGEALLHLLEPFLQR